MGDSHLSPTKIIASATLGPKKVDAKRWGQRRTIEATLRLHAIGDQTPYFSATAEIINGYKAARGSDDPLDAAGCIHDEILRYFPEAAPVVHVHLATEDGVPMHAFENARYWLGWTSYPERRNLDALAHHLRISEPIADIVARLEDHPDAFARDDALRSLIERLSVRWKHEANVARLKIEELGATDSAVRSIARSRARKAAMVAAEVKIF